MTRHCLVASLLVVFASSVAWAEDAFRPRVLGTTPPVVTEFQQLDKHLNRLVAIRGVVPNTKIPRIVGVEVRCRDDVRGKDVYAVGILRKWSPSLGKGAPRPAIATAGAGVRYVLYFDLSGKLAEARRWPVASKDSK